MTLHLIKLSTQVVCKKLEDKNKLQPRLKNWILKCFVIPTWQILRCVLPQILQLITFLISTTTMNSVKEENYTWISPAKHFAQSSNTSKEQTFSLVHQLWNRTSPQGSIFYQQKWAELSYLTWKKLMNFLIVIQCW
jgi:hypothetical protein